MKIIHYMALAVSINFAPIIVSATDHLEVTQNDNILKTEQTEASSLCHNASMETSQLSHDGIVNCEKLQQKKIIEEKIKSLCIQVAHFAPIIYGAYKLYFFLHNHAIPHLAHAYWHHVAHQVIHEQIFNSGVTNVPQLGDIVMGYVGGDLN